MPFSSRLSFAFAIEPNGIQPKVHRSAAPEGAPFRNRLPWRFGLAYCVTMEF